jgi:hypothetical protein
LTITRKENFSNFLERKILNVKSELSFFSQSEEVVKGISAETKKKILAAQQEKNHLEKVSFPVP